MEKAQVRLYVRDSRNADRDIVELQDWLRSARLDGLLTERERRTRSNEEMGPELLDILNVILASAALVELVRSLHVWLGTRRRKVSIDVEIEGRKVSLCSEGPDRVDDMMAALAGALATIRQGTSPPGMLVGS